MGKHPWCPPLTLHMQSHLDVGCLLWSQERLAGSIDSVQDSTHGTTSTMHTRVSGYSMAWLKDSKLLLLHADMTSGALV